ncbi:hypothetical protein [Sphingobacterium sp. BIGb0116]|uniref:hypothetical protein n=1 Tax=Sphingobacterium sp. BIGb0116 TaxID=2940619 RepID=UPI002166E8F8|nr:hypothetical protein [Sphingobacterium sp. BIGb0116]MCS4165147.1 hypothetical protein [Sphingobacterium sp. BIGb0116]
MEAKETKWLYETILSGPGMDEQVKFSFTASRKVILLLAEAIENGLKLDGSGLKESIGPIGTTELEQLKELLLEKSNLSLLANQLMKIK